MNQTPTNQTFFPGRNAAARTAGELLTRFPLWPGGLVLLFSILAAPAARAQPAFSKAFSPDTIGPGSVSTLTFTINNESGSPVTDLAFTDPLPVPVVIATPAGAATDCAGATLSAPEGGGTITLSGGAVGAFASCTVTVNVTSSTVGVHTNTSGDLTSSAGNSGTAADDLTVAAERPGFSKSFSPGAVSFGGRSTLTFTIDNSANQSLASSLAFTDNLPAGMTVADPPAVSNTCTAGPFTGGTVTAEPGSGTVSLTSGGLDAGAVDAGSTCTITVDVTGGATGQLNNTSGELTSVSGFTLVSSGKASAALDVTATTLSLTKSFAGDPALPGGTVDLEFTVTNFDRDSAATGIGFTDDLEDVLSGLVATGLPLSDPCGPGSLLSGTSLLSFTGGSLGPGASCTFSVTLQTPAGAATGVFPNTTSQITGEVGGEPAVGNAASDDLFVEPAPLLTKEILDPDTLTPISVAGTGEEIVLRFTVQNTSSASNAADIAFLDSLGAFLPGTLNPVLPANGSACGPATTFTTFATVGELFLSMSGGSLAPDASCSFDVTLPVPVGAPSGVFTNTTEEITATVGGETVTGQPASAELTVAGAPVLSKEFTDDPVIPGEAVTLEFTLTNGGEQGGNTATGIAFTDDLAAALPGLAAIGLPQTGVCGAGSEISGTTNLSFTGGSLDPGESCTFSVTIQVPGPNSGTPAPSGTHINTTSSVVATALGVTATGSAASGELVVSGLTFTKSFTDDPVLPGGNVTLQFTLDNTGSLDATGISFADDLNAVLPGLQSISGTVADVCGAGSQIMGTSSLIFSGGNLAAGASCTFDVTLEVPAGAASDTFGNATSELGATVDGSTIVLPAASDQLTVNGDILLLTKSFTDDPVAPGGTVTLEFTISNLDAAEAITGISFTDDLDAALSGLAAVGLPQNDVCGAGSQFSGTDVLTLTGGTLAPGSSCTFSATLMAPAAVPSGTNAVNTTSEVTGSAGALPVTGAAASDELRIALLSLTKSFTSSVQAGETVTLSFTIENRSSSEPASDLRFTDDLSAVMPGLAAVSSSLNDVCGPGSLLSGTSLLTLTGGNLLAGGSCTFGVQLQAPASAAIGIFSNTTSELQSGGVPVADAAAADLTVIGMVTNTATATADGAAPAAGQTTDTVEP